MVLAKIDNKGSFCDEAIMKMNKPVFNQLNIIKNEICRRSPEFKLALKSLLVTSLPGGSIYAELMTQLYDYIVDKDHKYKEKELVHQLEQLSVSHDQLLSEVTRIISTLNNQDFQMIEEKSENRISGDHQGHQLKSFSNDCSQESPPPQPTIIDLGDQQLKMCLCPSGTFWMGSDPDVGDLDEQPKHQVTLSRSFMLSDTLITQGVWQAIMQSSPSRYRGNPLVPVDSISWFEALTFCNRLSNYIGLQPVYELNTHTRSLISVNTDALGYRLPSEVEWEYAAKATTEYIYSGSNNLREVAKRESIKPPQIRSAKANPWGLYDMTGLLWTWCLDYMSMSTYQELGPHSINPVKLNPSKRCRVIRGGSWNDPDELCRIAMRSSEDMMKRSPLIGLRIAQTKA